VVKAALGSAAVVTEEAVAVAPGSAVVVKAALETVEEMEVEETAGLAVVASVAEGSVAEGSVAAGSVVAGLDTPYNHTSVVQSDTDTTRRRRFELQTPRRNWAVCSPR
jgi:hypothetical protein